MKLDAKLEKDLTAAYRQLAKYVETMGAKIASSDVTTFDLTVNIINEMVNGMNEIISSNNVGITQALADLKKENDKYLKEAQKRVPKVFKDFTGFDQNSLNALIQMQYIGIETVQAQFVEAIKSATVTYINTPTSINTLLTKLRGQIDQLEAHTKTQLNTFYREYSQTLENQIAKDIGFGEDKDDIWKYSGAPLQTNSHPECIWALTEKDGAPYFTNEEKELFEAGGLFSHSEPRWNCQHDFVMTNLTYAEAFGREAVEEKTVKVPEFKNYKEGKEWAEKYITNEFLFLDKNGKSSLSVNDMNIIIKNTSATIEKHGLTKLDKMGWQSEVYSKTTKNMAFLLKKSDGRFVLE